jgi:hypothetical protein
METLEWESARSSRDSARLRAFAERFAGTASASQAQAEIQRLENEGAAAGIQDVVSRYRAAFESRDIGALRAAWPSLSGTALQAIDAAFKNSRSIQMSLQCSDPQLSGNNATIPCRRKQAIQMKTGERLSPEHSIVVHLKRAGNSWVIDSIQ